MEYKQFCLDIGWDPVKTRDGTPYQYGQPLSRLSEEKHGLPVVYRWSISKSGAPPHACYIGETDNLFRRVRNYLHAHPSQGQVSRVAQIFKDEMDHGSIVALQVLRFETFFINGRCNDIGSLSHPAR